jgi:hypothetical protein
LKEKGFADVKIMNGGIHNWLSSGFSLVGSNYQRDSFDQVNLDSFYMDYDNGLIEVVNALPDKESNSLTDDAKSLVIGLKENEFNKQLQKRIKQTGGKSKSLVVVISEEDYAKVKTILNLPIKNDIYYLVGDNKSITNYKRKRVAVNQTRINGPTANDCKS